MSDELAASRIVGLLNEGRADGAPAAARVAVLAACVGDRAFTVGLAAEGRTAPDADARFLTYSVTKTMSAAVALRLAERGVLDLDAPLDRWLPDFAAADRITLEQVLAHRASLYNYGGIAAYHAAVRAGEEPWSEDEFLARCGGGRLFGPPGLEFSYSNIGYLLVKRVLERASGLSFRELLERELFAPLGLTTLAPAEKRADLDGLLFGPSPYLGGDGPPRAVAGLYHPGWVSHGVVAGTALDTARLLHGLFTDGLLSADSIERMTDGESVYAPLCGRPCVEPAYGLGLMMELDEQAGPYWGHTGGGPGCSVVAHHHPAKNGAAPVTVAVFTDGEDPDQAEWMAVEAAQALRMVDSVTAE